MWKKILIGVVLILIANMTAVYAGTRAILGSNWTVKNKKLQTRFDVVLPGSLDVEKPIGVGDGLGLHGSEQYFHILVSGIHYNENPLPAAFDNCLIFDTHEIKNVNFMEVAFWDAENARPSLILNQGAPGRASRFERSLIIGAQKGVKALDGFYTLCTDFPNLLCDTSLYGADFGVENNLEVLGIIYVDQIKESTPGVGVTIDSLKADDLKTDNLQVDEVLIADTTQTDDLEVNDSVKLLNFAGGGNRTVKVDNDGNLYVE